MQNLRVSGLVSGGKDSLYNLLECHRLGHTVVAIGNLHPAHEEEQEIDSYMYQSVGHHMVDYMATAMGVPLFRQATKGVSVNRTLEYTVDEEDEVEDLLALLQQIKEAIPDVNAVACGAILSNYQRVRLEHVCERLGLIPLCFLWQRRQRPLLQDMIDSGMEAILVKCASYGLLPRRHNGMTIREMQPELEQLAESFGCNECGEGGEYETLVLDCPLFVHGRIVIDKTEVAGPDADNPVNPSGILHITEAHLEPKVPPQTLDPISLPLAKPKTTHTLNTVFEGVPECESRATGNWIHVYGKGYRTANELIQAWEQELQRYDCVTLANAFSVFLCVPDMNSFAAINAVYVDYFKGTVSASRACIQSSSHLFSGDVVLSRTEPQHGFTSLHVRSISRWAPACIGPYSQATTTCGIVFLAGQIGLRPETMVLEEDTIQLFKSVQHVKSVLEATNSDSDHILFQLVFRSSSTTAADYHLEAAHGTVQVEELPRGASCELCTIAITTDYSIEEAVSIHHGTKQVFTSSECCQSVSSSVLYMPKGSDPASFLQAIEAAASSTQTRCIRIFHEAGTRIETIHGSTIPVSGIDGDACAIAHILVHE